MIVIHDVTDGTNLPRLLAEPLAHALRSDPVVVVTGARQTGKTTLARLLLGGPKRTYLPLDDFDMQGQNTQPGNPSRPFCMSKGIGGLSWAVC